MKKIRVLIVDDSAFVRKALRRMLSTEQDIEVVDAAADGREAMEKVCRLKPDIVTLDVRMAGMDGLTALERIMRDCPTPVLMLSSLTREGADITLKALDLGAVDFIDKTRAESSMDITLLANELVTKVRAIAGVDTGKLKPLAVEPAPPRAQETAAPLEAAPQPVAPGKFDVVAIGTSTGGPTALQHTIPRLPRHFPAAVIVVQHMPPGFTRTLAERLNALSFLPVTEAVEGERLEPGRVLVAPAGQHLKLVKKNGRYVVHLDREPSDLFHKPSVDVMMESVARACGHRSLGVLLTGMGSDGARGMKAIKDAGGRTLAESEETCIVYGMPKSAVEEGAVDRIVPLNEMAGEIVREM